VTVADGKADRGGGLRNEGGWLELTDVVVQSNRAFTGGGIYNDGQATLTNVIIRGNSACVENGLFNTRRAIFSWRRSPARGAVNLGFPLQHRRIQHESHRVEV
jgi:hypothetical protein